VPARQTRAAFRNMRPSSSRSNSSARLLRRESMSGSQSKGQVGMDAPDADDRERKLEWVALVLTEQNVRHGDDGHAGATELLQHE
jgi:hypothetical protein